MPFPLLSLSYGLQIRLRELCSNNEAFCLQIAAAGTKNYILPLTKIRTYSRVNADTNADGELEFFEELDTPELVKIKLTSTELLEITDNIIIEDANFELTLKALSIVYKASKAGKIFSMKYNSKDPKCQKLQQRLYLNELRGTSMQYPWLSRGFHNLVYFDGDSDDDFSRFQ
uniref:Uncharacterized protein n=1 Tax=Panagrellus redivivus TaxID=6233 RepID=A0A7E4UTI3_PANRE